VKNIANDYVIRVLNTPLDIDSAQWNTLLAAQASDGVLNPFMRHEYLCAMHQSGSATPKTGWTPRFVTLWHGELLVAACALYLKTHSYGEYVFDHAWANAYAQHGLEYYPKALVAVPFTPVPGIRLLAGTANERTLLVQALVAWCEDEKLSSLHLLFADDADIAACEEAGLMLRHTVQFHWSNVAPTLENVAPTLPTACGSLDVPARDAQALRAVQTRAGGFGAAALSPEGAAAPADWQSQIRGPNLKNAKTKPANIPGTSNLLGHGGFTSFDDFLMSLSQEKRKKIRQERRKVAEAGITFRWSLGKDISDADWDFFYHCYERTYYEHGNAPYLSRDFFKRMQQTMPENWLLFVAEYSPDGGSLPKQPVATSLIAVSDSCTSAPDINDSKTDVKSEFATVCLAEDSGDSRPPAGRVAYGRYWGALARVDCLHFEACYYQPLEWCITHGMQRFEGGAQGEHKMARALLPVKTTSAHWLAHPSFADAVERFLEREGAGIDNYMEDLERRSPFKQAV
jgi:hypothetical protein